MDDEIKIEDIETLRVQEKKFKTCLSSIKEAVKRIWNNPFLDHYTKHDINHSHEVIKFLDKILKCGNCTLNEHERFILLAAAYLHDIGMQFPTYAGLPRKIKEDYTAKEKEKVREKHHEISAKIILDSVLPKSSISLGLEMCKDRYPDFIATVSKYHRKLSLEAEELQNTSIAGETIRLRLLAALLRLADALDQTYERVNLELLEQWDIPFESKVYWYLHYYVQSVDIDKNGCIKVWLGLPEKYKKDNKIIRFFENKVKETIKRHLSDVYKILWQHDIKLYNPEESPEIKINYFRAIKLLPDDLLKYIKTAQKIADEEELTIKTGVVWYIDGIPYSDNVKLVKCLGTIFSFVEEENYLKAVKEVEKGRALVMNPLDKITFSIIAGNIYYITGNLNDAKRYYEDAINFSEREDLKEVRKKAVLQARSAALGNIGLIYSDKGDLDKALEYHQQALKIDREIGYKQGEASDLGNIGLIYRAKGDLDKALEYHQQALKVFIEIKAPSLITQTLVNIATIFFEQNSDKEGFKYLGKAVSLSLSTSVDEFNKAFFSLLQVIRNMVSRGDWERLETISSIYTSKIIMEKELTDFLKAIYEYALWMKTSKDTNKRRFEKVRQRLKPFFKDILGDLIKRV